MTGTRIFLLTLLALVIGAIGLYLVFEPAPEEPLDEVAMRTQAIAAMSASTGLGVLVPKMAFAAQIVEPHPGQASVLVAVARKTKTPTAPPTNRPTDQPTIQPTASPTLEPTIRPIEPPPTAIPFTLTPAPTEPPRPTRTPRPTKVPPPTTDPNAPEPTPAPPPAPPPSGAALTAAIGSCGAITKPGGYYLTGALSSSGDCLNIRSSNVTLDCKGNAIRGVDFNGVGVVVRKLGILGNERPKKIEIRNCTISGYRYGIYVEASSGIYIHHNVLTKNYDDVDGRRYGIFLGMVEGGGIRLNESDHGVIENNNANSQAIGIDVRSSANISINGNDSSNNSAWGINLLGTSSSQVAGNTTNGNVRYCTWGAGVVGPGCDAGGIILQDGSNGNRILNNEVGSGNGNGIFIKAHGIPCGNNNVIAGNSIHDIMYNAVELGFCTGNQVVGNNIHNSIDGIWMGFAKGNVIKDNTIANMNNHGIIVLNSLENEVSGNQIINARDAIYFFWEQKNPGDFWWLDVNAFPSRNNRIFSNTLRDNAGSGIFLENSTDNQVHNNVFANNAKNIKLKGNTNGNEIRDNQEGRVDDKLRKFLLNFFSLSSDLAFF